MNREHPAGTERMEGSSRYCYGSASAIFSPSSSSSLVSAFAFFTEPSAWRLKLDYEPARSKRQDLWAYPRTGPLYTMSAMTRFTIAVFLHLVGMVGLFIGYGLEWVASSLLRRSTNAEQVRAWLRIYRLSLPISGPGLLLLILSGVYFASITESMKQGWLLTSLLAIVFAFGIGFVFILPRVRMLRAVLPEGNTPLSEAGRASVQDPVILTLIRVRFLLALGILYLMIAKPDLATSLFILLGAIVVGLISAATAWRARPARFPDTHSSNGCFLLRRISGAGERTHVKSLGSLRYNSKTRWIGGFFVSAT